MIVHCFVGPMDMVVWRDGSIEVAVLSSVPHITRESESPEIHTVARIDQRSSNNIIVMNRPRIIEFFSKFMGGVDLL